MNIEFKATLICRKTYDADKQKVSNDTLAEFNLGNGDIIQGVMYIDNMYKDKELSIQEFIHLLTRGIKVALHPASLSRGVFWTWEPTIAFVKTFLGTDDDVAKTIIVISWC